MSAKDLTALPRTDEEKETTDFRSANMLCEQNGRLYRMPIKQVEDTMFSDFSTLKEYGVCFDHNTKTPTLTRVGAAAGKVASYGIGKTNAVNDFDSIYPYSHIKRCTLADDGTVTAYEGDVNYTEDGSIGQVMVEFPKFYYKRIVDEASKKEYYYICKEKLTGYSVWPSFADAQGNEITDKIYIAPFITNEDPEDSNKHCSIAALDATSKFTYFALQTKAAERGDNWHNIGYDEYAMIQFLFMIEFATTNSESIFKGVDGSSRLEATANIEDYYNASTNKFASSNLVNADEAQSPLAYVGQMIDITFDLKKGTYTPHEDDYVEEEQDDGKGGTYQLCTTTREVTAIEPIYDENDETIILYYVITFDREPVPIFEEDIIREAALLTGDLNRIKASSGVIGESNLRNLYFKYRGLEYPFGVNYTWVNGVVMREGALYVTTDITKYGERDTSDTKKMNLTGYINLGWQLPAKGYISKLGLCADAPWALMPIETAGSSEEGYCDMQNSTITIQPTYDYVFRFGNGIALSGGLFSSYFNNTNAAANNNRYFGRLNCSFNSFHYAQQIPFRSEKNRTDKWQGLVKILKALEVNKQNEKNE